MNSRKYPRTLHEAFPKGPTYGCAIERPAPVRTRSVTVAVLCIVLLLIYTGVTQ